MMDAECQVPRWFAPYLSLDSRRWDLEDGILRLADSSWLDAETSLSFYSGVGGTRQADLATVRAHPSYYDRPRYARLVKQAISVTSRSRHMALDLGCGDGRGTRMLLESGLTRIVAVDFHLPSLQHLVQTLTRQERAKVVPIWAPITIEPIGNLRCDFAICIEVLTTLPSPTDGLLALRRWMKEPGGVSLVVEPAVEGSLAYAFISRDLASAQRILTQHRRQDRLGNHTLDVHLSTQKSLVLFMREGGFRIVAQQSIPAGAALALHMLRTGGTGIGTSELEMVDLANALEEFAPRMHAVIGQVL